MTRYKISELQRMLRYIGEKTGVPTEAVAVNGMYTPETKRAVAEYKRSRGIGGLPDTVDETAWNAITAEYKALTQENGMPIPLDVFPSTPGYAVRRGEASDFILLIQSLLSELRYFYDGYGRIPLTGVYDGPTEEAVREFQRANMLEADGILGKQTWDRMASEFNGIQRKRL